MVSIEGPRTGAWISGDSHGRKTPAMGIWDRGNDFVCQESVRLDIGSGSWGNVHEDTEDDSLTQDFHEYAHSTHDNPLDIMNLFPYDKLLYQSSLHFTLNGRPYRQPHQPRMHPPPRGCPFSKTPTEHQT